jgi:hypothetical protein
MPPLVNPEGESQHFVKSGSPGLPASYGRTKVVVLPIDPFHVHAYWEVTEKDRLLAMKRLDPMGAHRLSWVLRFHDVSSPRARERDEHFDVFVDRAARNWYIELWSPGRRYWVELGTAFGARFSPVSRSREIELPRAAPAPPEPQRADGESGSQRERGAGRAGGIAALSPREGFEGPEASGAAHPAAAFEVPPAEAGWPSAPEPIPGEPRRAGPAPQRVLARESPSGDGPGGPTRSFDVDPSNGSVGSLGTSSAGLGRRGKRA